MQAERLRPLVARGLAERLRPLAERASLAAQTVSGIHMRHQLSDFIVGGVSALADSAGLAPERPKGSLCMSTKPNPSLPKRTAKEPQVNWCSSLLFVVGSAC